MLLAAYLPTITSFSWPSSIHLGVLTWVISQPGGHQLRKWMVSWNQCSLQPVILMQCNPYLREAWDKRVSHIEYDEYDFQMRNISGHIHPWELSHAAQLISSIQLKRDHKSSHKPQPKHDHILLFIRHDHICKLTFTVQGEMPKSGDRC